MKQNLLKDKVEKNLVKIRKKDEKAKEIKAKLLRERTNKEIEAMQKKAEKLINKRVQIKTIYEYSKLVHSEIGVITFVSDGSLIFETKDRNKPIVVHLIHVVSITELKIEESKKKLLKLALKEDEAELRKLKNLKVELKKEQAFTSKLVKNFDF